MFLRSFRASIFPIWFFERSSDARLLHFSRPVRSLICMLAPLIVERLATSASVIGLSLSRFSKTNLRTAASRFLSGKIETSTLLVEAAGLFVCASKFEGRSKARQIAVQHPLVNGFIALSLEKRRKRCQKYLVFFQISCASF